MFEQLNLREMPFVRQLADWCAGEWGVDLQTAFWRIDAMSYRDLEDLWEERLDQLWEAVWTGAE